MILDRKTITKEMFAGGTSDRTILTLPLDGKNLPIRRSSDSSDIGERHCQILTKMQPEREYSSEEISELVGLKGSGQENY